MLYWQKKQICIEKRRSEAMKDLIKEFTMLDLLGMIFPGSVLMVLICAECGVWPVVQGFVGESMMTAVKTVVILFGGYALGMLLHDIGDVFEHLLWRNPLFNPKVTVLIDKVYLKNYFNEQKGKKRGEEKMCACHAAAVLFRRFPRWFRAVMGVPFLFLVMSALGLGCVFYAERELAFRADSLWLGIGGTLAMILVVSLGCWGLWVDLTRKDADLPPYSKIVPKADSFFSIIQTDHKFKTSGKGDASKVNLFDGFRAMARNLLVAVFCTYLLAHFSSGTLHDLFLIPLVSPLRSACFYVLLLLLILRYWHYSYLEYKYIYEDIAYMDEQGEEEGKKKKNLSFLVDTLLLDRPRQPK